MSYERPEVMMSVDGDIVVVFGCAPRLRAVVSDAGRPCRGVPYPLDDDDEDYYALDVSEERARLMVVHGCSHEDLELDRAIWAAAYVASPYNHERSAEAAEGAVLRRWLAKGGDYHGG